jgi:hypothetical protein
MQRTTNKDIALAEELQEIPNPKKANYDVLFPNVNQKFVVDALPHMGHSY